jgi:hypothetical protein
LASTNSSWRSETVGSVGDGTDPAATFEIEA